MKKITLFLLTTLISFLSYILISGEYNKSIPSFYLYDLDHREVKTFVNKEKLISFTPYQFESFFIKQERSVDYDIKIPISFFYNSENETLNIKVIQDLNKLLNIISKNNELSSIEVTKESILVGSTELVQLTDFVGTYEYPFIDLTGHHNSYFTLEYTIELLNILKHPIIKDLNPVQADMLFYNYNSFVTNTSLKLIAAFNPAINLKDKYKAQQILYLMQILKDNPDLIEAEKSPLNSTFFKEVDKDKVMNQYKKIHNI